MGSIVFWVDWVMLGAGSLFLSGLCLTSFREKEFRAAAFSGGFLVIYVTFWCLCLLTLKTAPAISLMAIAGFSGFGLLSFFRFFPEQPPERDTSSAVQYDERDHMFARNNLKHHPDLMKTYHDMRPENESWDKRIHDKPDFGDERQVFHDPLTAPGYGAAFAYLEKTIPLSDGDPADTRTPIAPGELAKAIIEFAKFYGALDVGVVRLKPYHFYSHRGRHGRNWGQKTDQTYKTAIAIVVPMRVDMIKQAPTSCVIQESAREYVEAAKISNILAGYIRNFGYRARAHNDANYDTLCVPIALEAGLGELGRMGILMHRTHGPCIRLAVVTTDLKLPETAPGPALFMEAFCRICKKCADNCPSGSITHGEEPETRNIRHWSILQEKCFSYWKTIGSDCGMCLSVCPYTKPDTLIHRLVRVYISRNFINQKIALFMDDLFYGRKKQIAGKNPAHIFDPGRSS